MERYGFDIVRYGNSEEKVQENQIYYRTKDANEMTIKKLEDFLGVEAQSAENTPYSPEKFSTQAQVIVILGEEFMTFKKANSKKFY